MSVADRLNKLSTDITNAYTSIENKGGTIPSDKNTDNLHTAIDSIQSSNIIGATAEGESLNLTNTKAMPYSDYVVKGKSEQDGEPSPSNPSEIHSVADDVNLFDASKIANSSISVTDNGKTIIMPVVTSGNGNTNTATKLNVLCPDLQVGDVIYIRFKRNLNNNKNKFIYLYGSNKIMYAMENSPSYTITQDDLNSYVFLYGNDYDYGETEQCIITDFKIQKNKITPYSPYNQGTVTIKQRGKNLFDLKSYLTNRGVTYTENSDGSITFSTTINLYSNTFTFSSSNTNVSLSGIITKGTATNARIQLLNSSNVVVGEITSSKISYENLNANQLRFNYSTSGTITLKNIQLEERLTSNRLRTISRL